MSCTTRGARKAHAVAIPAMMSLVTNERPEILVRLTRLTLALHLSGGDDDKGDDPS